VYLVAWFNIENEKFRTVGKTMFGYRRSDNRAGEILRSLS